MQTWTAVAHRGDPYRFRENTLASLRSALDRGADAVEIDVRLTRDGVPVLLHDDTLKRLWEVDRPLSALTASQVTELTAGGIPTLAEALSATEGTRVMADLCGGVTPRVADRVLDAVRQAGAEDRVYYSSGAQSLLTLRAAAPKAELALTWTTTARPRPALLTALRPHYLNYRFSLVDRDLANRVHKEGYLLSVWTPDTTRSMRKLLTLGADSITTNRIDTLTALRQQRG
ncbi:glycerophosphodiester phosphodiesterase [Streptomyces sp. SID2999]|uniref:glycerophosphodiester phosphodiesterase n=1 Tax=Streptomyces sp. SID2999 TaxID=2690258 RepID=UPI00136E497D|nr:glycerophosphodiester phosphodiesterase [Streptomyces sp. SID2999]MYZ11456.1 glycerophosphodiester phosphodiesterase [Streptomyces sp. SID2999]